ncbi:MAG TPA: class I SAM-dependent methyltransferase, partial [Gemmatirosa sp.]|nr:class I SAM-dependent methyltransferase [Gemmatirosa sp.]
MTAPTLATPTPGVPPPGTEQAPDGDPPAPGRGLRLERAACCVCGTADAEPVGVGEDFEYRTSADTFLAVRCRGCGVVYLDPRPAESELDRIYPPSYHAYDFSERKFGLAYRVRRRLEARRVASWCVGLSPDARILDVGCGDGFHLRILREMGAPGWRLEGADASERAVSAARAAGLTVHHGLVQTLDLPRGAYDLVLLVATIEHVADPLGVLRAVRALLRPGGRVVIVTDNTDTPSFTLFRRRHWGGYHWPRHWYLFDPASLRSLGARAGFEVVEVATTLSPVNWVYSFHNLLADLDAPRWLTDRFGLSSAVSLGVFTVYDGLHVLFGRGGLLRAVLRRPA